MRSVCIYLHIFELLQRMMEIYLSFNCRQKDLIFRFYTECYFFFFMYSTSEFFPLSRDIKYILLLLVLLLINLLIFYSQQLTNSLNSHTYVLTFPLY